MRNLGVLIVILSLPIAARADDCPPFKELRPPQIRRDRSVLWFSRGVDPAWFDCARKAGGRLHARSLLKRENDTDWELDSGTDNVGAHVHIGAWASNYCSRIGKADPVRVRFELIGEGALAKASYRSDELIPLCGCGKSRDVRLDATASSAGISFKGGFNPDWLTCMREGGGTLELRAYTGATEEAAGAANQPAAVLAGLQRKANFAGTFPRAELCAGGARFAVVEVTGRGTLGGATGEGRMTVPLQCN